MNCKKCGVVNLNEAQYCMNCGQSFEKVKKDDEIFFICRKCGYKSNVSESHCIKCGKPFEIKESIVNQDTKIKNEKGKNIPKTKRMKESSFKDSKKRFVSITRNLKPILIAFAVVFGSILTIVIMDFSIRGSAVDDNKDSVNGVKRKFSAVDLGVTQVASKFICNCGDCIVQPLELCTCPTAVEERRIIRNYLEQSMPIDSVVKVIDQKYGGLRS